jgi:hypothetical protein
MSDFFSVFSRLSNTHTHTYITMIIILIIDVFSLAAFACVKSRIISLTNDGCDEQHNRSRKKKDDNE